MPIINVNAQEGQSSSSSVPILFADSCPKDSELKKDASFLDDLGKWLLTTKTSIHFLPFMNNSKKIMLPQEGALRKDLLKAKSKLKYMLVVRPQKKKLQMI